MKATMNILYKNVDDLIPYELNLTTTTPSLVGALKRDPQWVLSRYGRASKMDGYAKRYNGSKTAHLANTTSMNRITYSFWYKEQ